MEKREIASRYLRSIPFNKDTFLLASEGGWHQAWISDAFDKPLLPAEDPSHSSEVIVDSVLCNSKTEIRDLVDSRSSMLVSSCEDCSVILVFNDTSIGCFMVNLSGTNIVDIEDISNASLEDKDSSSPQSLQSKLQPQMAKLKAQMKEIKDSNEYRQGYTFLWRDEEGRSYWSRLNFKVLSRSYSNKSIEPEVIDSSLTPWSTLAEFAFLGMISSDKALCQIGAGALGVISINWQSKSKPICSTFPCRLTEKTISTNASFKRQPSTQDKDSSSRSRSTSQPKTIHDQYKKAVEQTGRRLSLSTLESGENLNQTNQKPYGNGVEDILA